MSDDTVVLLAVGELIPRKNHELVLKALKNILDEGLLINSNSPENPNPGKYKLKFLIAGLGQIDAKLREEINSSGLSNIVNMLGFRSDVVDLLHASDIFVFPSHQEGLPVALMEAMSVGLPTLVSSIRGNTDLIEDEKGGFLFDSHDAISLESALKRMLDTSEDDLEEMGEANVKTMGEYDIQIVNKRMKELYRMNYRKV